MSEHSERLIQPEPPDELKKETRRFWREVGQTMVRESIAATDESARQIIGVAGILEGLYFHAIAYSDLRGQVAGGAMFVYLAPIVLLLLPSSPAWPSTSPTATASTSTPPRPAAGPTSGSWRANCGS